ncbi:MAG TPA: glycosyl hydrolase, partial [Pyrinomonadaceae bacterium]
MSLFLVAHLLAPAGVLAQGARRGGAAAGGRQSSAPLAWPRVTRQSKPWTRWWWLGNVAEKRELTEQLKEYERAGLGGVEITPIYGVKGHERRFVDFLSPAWVDLLEHTLREAERLGMGVDMATGTGWPFGGPWVGADDAPRYFAHQSYSLKGGGRLEEPVRYVQKPLVRAVGQRPDIRELKEPVSANANLQALALDQVRFEKPLPLQVLMAYSDKSETLDLTGRVGADGRLDWVAPAGDWKLYALFQGWHGKMVERAAPGGEGNVIDHFSDEALKNYLKKFDRAFAGRNIGSLRAFFNDSYEVDDAEGQADWTPRFFEEFRARRGYDLRRHLPALAGDASDEEDARVIYDLR